MSDMHVYRRDMYRDGRLAHSEVQSLSAKEVAVHMTSRIDAPPRHNGTRLEFLELLNRWNKAFTPGGIVYVFTAE